MNLFTDSKTPAILTIFIAVVGFYISTVVTEIRGQSVLTYRFATGSDGAATLRLKNVSLSSLVPLTRFEIACSDQRAECLSEMPGGAFHALGRVPPVSPANTEGVSDAAGAVLVATLVPGAIVEITVQAATPGTDLEFFYTASRDNPEPLLLLDAGSPTALFVDNYFDIMVLAFVIALAGLVIVILYPLLPGRTAKASGADAPKE
ncbi:hypothetical protein [Primorskyibacter sp. 2E233]|uniref:hypothetical protein n=1 Tax=Primorskyibacter sp. 2E233 TaxID=3413431 RepID=UPI003BF3B1A9